MAVDTPQANGLKTVVDTIVAPKEAFASIRVAPTWGWALLITIVIVLVSSYLTTPAAIHGVVTDWPNTVAKSPALAGQTAEQQQAGLAMAQKITSFVWIFTPIFVLIGILIGTVIMAIFNALGRGDGTFAKYWASQCNIAIVAALGAVILAVIVLVRGPDSFTSAQSVQEAMPNLGALVPGTGKLHVFLSVFTPFSVWATLLSVAALSIVGRVPRVQAWLGGSLTLVLPGLIAAAFAH
jgi:Yip1 domain